MKGQRIGVAIVAVGTLILAWDTASPEPRNDDYDIHAYGRECARLIAEIPPFNCLDGEIIPITVNGKTPAAYTRHMRCDKPAYLPYPEETDGQCTPYSRVRAVRDDDIQMILYCRRMYIRPPDDPRFDSIESIMHNVKTGSTCFFISKNFGEKPEGDDGRRVPPPTEETPPQGFISARELWASPQQVFNHRCIACHDSDPWMHTPWIDQTAQVPSDPWGYHSVDVGGPFVNWPKPMSISTRGNSCTGCHRIGSLNTCKTQMVGDFGEQPAKMLQSIGQAPHGRFGAKEGTAYDDPNPVYTSFGLLPHGWMGIRLPEVNSSLWAEYDAHIRDLQRCCEDHSAPGCIVEPIENMKRWLERADAKDKQ
jgi:hypothetical protein